METETSKYLFLDTNVLLHYRFFTQIDWCDIVGVANVYLVICSVVLDELDEKRYDTRKHISERVRAITPVLKQVDNGNHPAGLPSTVRILLLEHMEGSEEETKGLKLNAKDDQIIMQIRCFTARPENANIQVALVANDFRLTRRAKNRGIEVLSLPDGLLIKQEDEYVKKLERRVKDLESTTPVLELVFAREDAPHKRKFKLGTRKMLSEEKRMQRLSDIKAKYTALIGSDPYHIMNAHFRDDAEASYAGKVIDYLLRYDKYLEELSNYYDHFRRVIGLTFLLRNTGTTVAEDIDTYLEFPSDIIVSDKTGVGPKPQPPREPRKGNGVSRPWSLDYSVFDSIKIKTPSIDLSSIRSIHEQQVHDFEILPDNRVHWYDKELKHNFSRQMEPVFVTFPQNVAPHSFDIAYSVCPANVPYPVEEKLHVEIME